MAAIIHAYKALEQGKSGLPQPIIFCRQIPAISDKAVSLNVPLAKKLAAIKPGRRTLRLEQCYKETLDSLPENPVINNIDVLFNPAYEVDILRIMASVGKNKPFQVIWPGKYEDGRLFYAEEGYRDYKVYDLEKYDVTCVI